MIEYKKKEDDEDISLAKLLKIAKQVDEKIFPRKVTGWLLDDCSIVPNKKKN